MTRPRIIPPLLVGLIFGGLAAFAATFAPEQQVWCNVCREFVDAPHSEAHPDAPNFGYCEKCEGFFPDGASGYHIHVGDPPRPAPPESVATNAPPPDGKPAPGGGSDFLRKALPWLWAVPCGLFGFFLLVSLLAHARSKKKGFRFDGGVPQGIVLRRDVLVCSEEGSFDGGTSQVYEARFNDGTRWEPAFVKRIIGRGMREDQRFPMIAFEAGVLRRLEQTGAVPRVLIDPETVALSNGSRWSYYAMSAAQGAPWPDHGGLGGDTHRALAALCEALMSLHDLGIGHHDLKPQNIFWDSRLGRITLLDFGSAIDHTGALVNPIGATYPKTLPWVAPEADGRRLADLSPLSDNWVYGLLFCEALVGGVHTADRTLRRTPEDPEDREWFRENLGRTTSPAIADAVVDGLFAIEKSRRMKLQEFLMLLRKEWEV